MVIVAPLCCNFTKVCAIVQCWSRTCRLTKNTASRSIRIVVCRNYRTVVVAILIGRSSLLNTGNTGCSLIIFRFNITVVCCILDRTGKTVCDTAGTNSTGNISIVLNIADFCSNCYPRSNTTCTLRANICFILTVADCNISSIVNKTTGIRSCLNWTANSYTTNSQALTCDTNNTCSVFASFTALSFLK